MADIQAKAHFILYVRDQAKSAQFYNEVLNTKPSLNVPGMTEFRLNDDCILGLMPEAGIKRLLGATIRDPALGSGIPRAELYLRVFDPEGYHERAIAAGAKELSAMQRRNWGDVAGYSEDPDGHVLVFAKSCKES